jgi:hypothetical protein
MQLIGDLARAIQIILHSEASAVAHDSQIDEFAEMIEFLAVKPDRWINNNIDRFSQGRFAANKIIKKNEEVTP